ncbi:MAG: TrkH family potassium uptake protein [Gaiellaceae bacterium]
MTGAQRFQRAVKRRSIGVSVRASLHALGRVLEVASLTLALPALVAAIYRESPLPFLVPLAVGLALGYLLERTNRGKGRLGTREVFLVIVLAWLAAALLGSGPYLIAADGLRHWTDAFMESMAGLTTTNISVVGDPGVLPHSLLFWRQFSQWLGGLGVIVLTLALLPRLRVGGREPTIAEPPGQEVERLARGVKIVIRRFGLLYLGLTVAAALILIGLALFSVDVRSPSVFDAICLSLSTVSTGGFSPHAGSLTDFSLATQWVVFVFMALAGANIVLIFLGLVRREGRPLLRDSETRLYVAIALLGAAGISAALVAGDVANGWGAIREGLFQSVSFLSTSGFTVANISTWPLAATAILVGLVLIGGCAFSLSGSQKILRVQIIGKLLHREVNQTVHPEAVLHVRINRRRLDERAVQGVVAFALIFFGLLAVGVLALELDAARMDFTLNVFPALADASAALCNGGPGLGFAGPAGSFAPFSDVSKLTLSALMLLGRLEIIPVAVLFSRSYWRP